MMTRSAPSGIVCLTGMSSGGHAISLDLGSVNRSMVLENDVVFGSVNANRATMRMGPRRSLGRIAHGYSL